MIAFSASWGKADCGQVAAAWRRRTGESASPNRQNWWNKIKLRPFWRDAGHRVQGLPWTLDAMSKSTRTAGAKINYVRNGDGTALGRGRDLKRLTPGNQKIALAT